MPPGSEDSQRRLMYINGTLYLASPVQVQSGGQLQQILLPQQQHHLQQQLTQPQRQQDGMPTGYVMASVPNSAGRTTMTLVPVAQGARHTPQVLVLHPQPTSMDIGSTAPEQTWVPLLANSSRVAFPDGGPQLPPYHAAVPSAAVSMEALQGVRVVSLPASAAGTATSAQDSVTLSDPPLHSFPSTSRQLAEQCLEHLSIHQRGTARLFVGQIHYDACEDDLYQIFGVYGHVSDVKIMRSGDANASSSATSRAEARTRTAAAVVAAASAGGGGASSSRGGPGESPSMAATPSPAVVSPVTNAPTANTAVAAAKIDLDSCNNSTCLKSVKLDSDSACICSGVTLPCLPPLATPLPFSTVAFAATSSSAQAAAIPHPATSTTNNNSLAVSSPKSNRRCNAFVTFSSMIEADTAISALHGRYVMGRDRPLQVTYCQATENISQFGFAHAVRLHKENKNNPLPFKPGAPTHR